MKNCHPTEACLIRTLNLRFNRLSPIHFGRLWSHWELFSVWFNVRAFAAFTRRWTVTSCLFSASAALLSTTTKSGVAGSNFSSSWILSDFLFVRQDDEQAKPFYYVVIVVNVSMMGNYSFTGESMIPINAYFYDSDLKPLYSSRNLITLDGNAPFRITATLQTNLRYFLIVIARIPDSLGQFSVVSSGPAAVSLRTFSNTTEAPVQSICKYRVSFTLFHWRRRGNGFAFRQAPRLTQSDTPARLSRLSDREVQICNM